MVLRQAGRARRHAAQRGADGTWGRETAPGTGSKIDTGRLWLVARTTNRGTRDATGCRTARVAAAERLGQCGTRPKKQAK